MACPIKVMVDQNVDFASQMHNLDTFNRLLPKPRAWDKESRISDVNMEYLEDFLQDKELQND
jgi:hypothetical protein